MGYKKRDLWYEDNRYSSILKDYIYLHEDNFVDWIYLAKSYHDAAQATIRSFYRGSEDQIVPISVAGSLYRHSIELILKVIVIIGKRSEGNHEDFLKNHNLVELWKESQSAMLSLYRNKERHWSINQIENKINMLNAWDKDATYFRYPRIGKDIVKHPNLRKLAWTCERIYNTLMLLSEDMWNRFAQQE